MEPRCVLVTHATDTSSEIYGISGIELASNWILTHGVLLGPSFQENEDHVLRDFLLASQKRLDKRLVEVAESVSDSLDLRVHYANEGKIESRACSLRLVWRCALLRQTFHELLFSWSFGKAAGADKSLLPIFLLLRLDGPVDSGPDVLADAREALSDFYAAHLDREWQAPRRGETLEIESAPFGSPGLLGSLSRGILSNVLGPADCLLLSDASALPGCEGAPVFRLDSREKRRVCVGLVLAPLGWRAGERVDYTFAANLRSCLSELLLTRQDGLDNGLTSSAMDSPDLLDRSLVVVSSGSGWGTGIVVDLNPGLVLTCSHVVRQMPGSRVKLRLVGEIEAWARLVYRTQDGLPYDVAVLKLEKSHAELRALPISSQLPAKGSAVLTAGFPLWRSAAASRSRGVVARSTSCMLQTTCCVQSGSSGGPVLAPAADRLVGLVVSNVDGASGLQPRFNMAVPASVLGPPLREYARTDDIRCLERLASSEPEVREAWYFCLMPRSRI